MKHYQILAILGSTLLSINVVNAAILTVDNKPGAVTQFTNFQDAYNAAQNGDTILLAGSPTDYSAPIIYKRLNIMGPGYNLSENQIPGVNSWPASISELVFAKHSQHGDASGSSVTGLRTGVNSNISGSGNSPVAVSVSRCYASGLSLGSGSSVSRSRVNAISVIASTSVRNCLLTSVISYGVGNTFSNCIISSASISDYSLNTAWSNIIFVSSSYTMGSFAAAVKGSVTHSMAVGDSILPGGRVSFLPAGGGNINNLNLTDVFVASGNEETRWMLKAGSPAIGSGFDGVDMGFFGGANPYRLSGLAPRPRITRFVVPAAATDATGLQFEVDAKAF